MTPDHDDNPIDLRALDPDQDPAAEARFVDAVMRRVAERAVPIPSDPLFGVWSLASSPALAAGIVIALAVGALGMRARAADRAPQTIAQAVGVPPEFLAGNDR